MPLIWSDSILNLDYDELARLYRVAPLGLKKPEDLKTVSLPTAG